MCDIGAQEHFFERRSKLKISFECATASTDQVITRFLLPFIGGGMLASASNFIYHLASDLQLRIRRVLGEVLDRVTVTIARQKIERTIAFMDAQALVHEAHILDEPRPFKCRDGAHADNDITHRPVIGDLLGVLPAHDFIESYALPVQPFIKKVKGNRRAQMRVVRTLQDLDGVCLNQGLGG